MTSEFILIGSYSITIAAGIALIRIKKVHRSYHPFIYIVFAALLNEICSSVLISGLKMSNAVTSNILGLLEGILWMWQFRRWEGFKKRKWEHHLLLAILIATWAFENIVLGKLFTFSSAYAILYSFLLVFLSINQVNRQIVEEKSNLLTNSKFLICTGTIIFYTYRIFVESFYVFDLQESNAFLSNVFSILAFVNLFVNLLFALATLWIPTRQRFSLPSL